MERELLEYGAQVYGTPQYIFNLDEMAESVAFFRSILREPMGLCFAIKANPFLVRQMAAVVDRTEVCSMGEFEICRKLNIEAEKVLISGVLKKQEDIEQILNYYRGSCRYTVESLNQFLQFAKWCEKNREEIQVYLRLTSGNQFGMDEKQLCEILAHRQQYPFIKIAGIHFFSGTQKKKKEILKKELTYLDDFLLKVEREFQMKIEELEFGPGIAVSYFVNQQDMIETDTRYLADAVNAMRWQGKVTLEMGRALVAKCGYYLTRVRDMKQNDGVNYCIVDGGIHQLNYDGQVRGMYQPYVQMIPAQDWNQEKNDENEQEWIVYGSLCSINDILIQKIHLKDLQINNILVFGRTGAYAMTEGIAMFLSHELPKIITYNKENGWKLVRDETQTYEWNMERE